MKILAIETSCDETAAAVVTYDDGAFAVHSNIVSSQVALHARYGGVVPNLAAREHEKNIIPVITQALTQAGVTSDTIDAIAVTHGPGLIPALIVGVSAAKTLAFLWRKPLLGIHHIEGHIYANALADPRAMTFPLLALVVSGGHTQLVVMRDHFHYDIIGQTLDDAVGEAFDKVARMLGLPYPGGPAIATAAQKHNATENSFASFTDLPRPMLHSKNYDFSFSGIKTAVLYRIKDFRAAHNLADDAPLPQNFVAAMSNAFEEAVCDVLIAKTLRAVAQYNIATLTIAGGVSANTRLRTQLRQRLTDVAPTPTLLIPDLAYCLDNATMIAAAGALRFAHLSPTQRDAARDAYGTLDAHATLPLSPQR